MDIKILQKAKRHLDRLAELDKEIRTISRLANELKDGKDNISLTLSHDRPASPERGVIDVDGYSLPGYFRMPSFLSPIDRGTVDEKETTKIKITDVISLQVLGVIIAHKESERMSIINQLNSLGVEAEI